MGGERPQHDGVPEPYGEHALLTAAMIADDGVVPEEERRRLLRYLEAVVAARPSPVHTAVAFNALYFGYDLAGEGYGRSPLRPDDFPVIALGEEAPALPVGAMVRIATGSAPLFAEIVYKEGAHPDVNAMGDVPAWVSGAPAGAEGPGREGATARRRELLVPDPHAFGPGLSLTAVQLRRLRSHRRWLNEDGHIVVDARYPSARAARGDGLAAYADHLLTTARAQLLSPLVPVSLAALAGGTGDDVLRPALLTLLRRVRDVLRASELLRTWGQYAMTEDALAARRRDAGALGGDDLRSLGADLRRAVTPVPRRHGPTGPATVYTAIGPRLRTVPGAGELLTGLGYASAVCHANAALADMVHEGSSQGLFPNGTRVALDDAFEGGGVWRSHWLGGTETRPQQPGDAGMRPQQPGGTGTPSQRLGGGTDTRLHHPGSTAPLGDPLSPAGQGWASTLPPVPVPVPVPAPLDRPLPDDGTLGAPETLRSDAVEIRWRVPLRLAHLRGGCLPLHPLVAEELCSAFGPRAVVGLGLEGGAEQRLLAELGDGSARLTGVDWPAEFFPGLLLHVRWPRGTRRLGLVTTGLGHRVRVGDRVVGHCYDPRVLTRDDAPGSDRDGDSAAGLGPRDLVLRTVRRCGLLTPDGHAVLDRAGLPFAAYGYEPAPERAAVLGDAVAELLAVRLLEPETGSRDVAGQPHFPARRGQPGIPLLAYRPAVVRLPGTWGEPGAGRAMGFQHVPGHLRRLLPGHLAGETQRAAFRDHCRRLGKADGWELPEGYTFVTQHTRGH
ncbi:hypothetical protein PV682_23810 [Streptomyces niveiscabiei]|uniref:hypothetical protein n=1 Tax=Streptomyces niveiscabiei TaxID=164115 RepID=UPI0029AE9441|nr:hypothetical protein [Streptomyces niveiscabiei]MDX3384466.1 hypothetical protein [Streptomyces niveiscabiei]